MQLIPKSTLQNYVRISVTKTAEELIPYTKVFKDEELQLLQNRAVKTDTLYRDVYYIVKKGDYTLNNGTVLKV